MTKAPVPTKSSRELCAVRAELDLLVFQRSANLDGLHTHEQADRYVKLTSREKELLCCA